MFNAIVLAAAATTWSIEAPHDAFDDSVESTLSVEADDGVAIFYCEKGKISFSIGTVIPFGKYPIIRTGRTRSDQKTPRTITYTVVSDRTAHSQGRSTDFAAREMLSSTKQIGIEIADDDENPVRVTFSTSGGTRERAAFLKSCTPN